jgi:Calx-beta domain/ASPIC and UnbV/FG-GAP-like repeat
MKERNTVAPFLLRKSSMNAQDDAVHNRFSSKSAVIVALIGFCIYSTVSTTEAQPLFERVTDVAGPFHTGESWGASWGDYNGDGRPDLYANNHRDRASLYRNNGDGSFTDVIMQVDTEQVLTGDSTQDLHGGTWADFDNDGDQDLVSARSSAGGRGQLFINENGEFTEAGSEYGLDGFTGGRLGAWFDYDNDGRLDIAAVRAKSIKMFNNEGGAFSETTDSVGLEGECVHDNYAQFADIDGDGRLEFFCGNSGVWPDRISEVSTEPFADITSVIDSTSHVNDTAMADFDNDGLTDIFQTRGRIRPTQARVINDNRIEFWMEAIDDQRGFSFRSAGGITVDLDLDEIKDLGDIFIGSQGVNPGAVPFLLDPADPDFQGTNVSSSRGLYIGYDTATQRWELIVSNDYGYIQVDSTAPASDLVEIGLQPSDQPLPPSLWINNGTGLPGPAFDKTTYAAGLGAPVLCNGAAAGDFDNDMDVDLYLVCRDGVENLANIYYENNGDGTFVARNGHGAEGPVGAGLGSGAGVGEGVAIADYDTDGFLDLFVTNGALLYPFGAGGPDEMFRNLGNGNHWIEMDLKGLVSNADGIGAKIYVTAGGVTQMREQNGGYRRWSQHHQRIHVGLALNTLVEEIRVEWPSGIVDVYSNISADALYEITEGSAAVQPAVLGAVPPLPAPQPGDECGTPAFQSGTDRGMFIWKDCAGGQWHVRATAGGNPEQITYTGSVISTVPLENVLPYSLEGLDVLDNNDQAAISYRFDMLNSGVDGFDFQFASGETTCINANLPAGAKVFLGFKHLPAPLPLDLETLDVCPYSASLSISDTIVDESAGTATFMVTLDAPSSDTVTVGFTTMDLFERQSLTVFDDDFETNTGWAGNPGGTDTASTGQWERGNPEATSSRGPKQLGSTTSGSFNLVTGAAAGNSAGSNDIDNGVTTIRSPDINIPAAESVLLSFQYYLAHRNNSSSADFLRVTAVGSGTSFVVLEELGASNDHDAAWQQFTGDLSDFAGQTIHLLVEAADASSGSLVEAAIDDVLITAEVLKAVSGSAIAGDDYTAATGALVFKPGETSIPVEIPIIDDGEEESDEFFEVHLTSAENAFIGDRFAVGTIRGNDSPADLLINIEDTTVDEGAGTATVMVNLSEPAGSAVIVDYATADGTAAAALDYTGSTGTVTIVAGETLATIDVPILDDTEVDGPEIFSVTLSNPVGALLGTAAATVTIMDNETPPTPECGKPAYDKAMESGVFAWYDCADPQQWHVRMTAGGQTMSYQGTVTSDLGFDGLAAVSQESSDTLTPDPFEAPSAGPITYTQNMGGAGQDGFDFHLPAGANACFDVTAPAGVRVWMGANRVAVTVPLNLTTFGDCGESVSVVSVADVEVNEDAGAAVFTVNLSSAPGPGEQVDVSYTTVDGTAKSGTDYISESGVLSFFEGEVQKTVTVTVIDDSDQDPSESFRLDLSGTATNSASAAATILDNETPPTPECGKPAYDKAMESGVFAWYDCADPQQWHVRMTAGGQTMSYQGTVTSDLGFDGLAAVSQESSDTLTPDPFEAPSAGPITYTQNMGGAGQDGFDFHLPAGANACFDVTAPAGVRVWMGANRVAVTVPLNLTTFGDCGESVSVVSVADVEVNEDAGAAVFTVNLSSAPGPGEQVDVSYTTVDGTAKSGTDYISESGVLSFFEGEVQKTVTVTVIDDSDQDPSESFRLDLSGAATNSASAAATILDNETPPTPECGKPAYDKAMESGVFAWYDCADPQQWHVRMTAGGQTMSYQGTVTSDLGFDGLAAVSQESSDTLMPDPFDAPSAGPIAYIQNVGGTGQDGFDFHLPAGANACFDVTAPPGVQVWIGANRVAVAVPVPVNPTTLEACSP